MVIATFNPLLSLLGGLLLGVSATLLLLFNGRIAGISGIMSGALIESGDRSWRVAFLAGLISGGAMLNMINPALFGTPPDLPLPLLVLAGLLIGVGASLGSGCTSGHGICGLPRFSLRSLVAVLLFIASAAVAVLLKRQFGGGL